MCREGGGRGERGEVFCFCFRVFFFAASEIVAYLGWSFAFLRPGGGWWGRLYYNRDTSLLSWLNRNFFFHTQEGSGFGCGSLRLENLRPPFGGIASTFYVLYLVVWRKSGPRKNGTEIDPSCHDWFTPWLPARAIEFFNKTIPFPMAHITLFFARPVLT